MQGYYEAPDDWYEQVGNECRNCEDLENKLFEASEFLKNVIHHMYSKDTLNVFALENDLDELCHVLGVQLCPEEMQIQRKIQTKKPIHAFAEEMARLQVINQ